MTSLIIGMNTDEETGMTGNRGRKPAREWLESERLGIHLAPNAGFADIRRRLGYLSQQEFADHSKLSIRSIRMVENGNAVTLSIVKRYVLGLRPAEALIHAAFDSVENPLTNEISLPWLELVTCEWDKFCCPASILRPEYRVVPFHGEQREADLKDLVTWCENGPDFDARLYYAVGGSGKTRLALELCRQLQSKGGWCAGFLQPEKFMKILDPWQFGRGRRPSVLVVVDYAGDDDKMEVLARVLETGKDAWKKHVLRVLMLDRSDDWIDRLEGRLHTRNHLKVHADVQRAWSFQLQAASRSSDEREKTFRIAAKAFHPELDETRIDLPDGLGTKEIYSNLLLIHTQALLGSSGKAPEAQKDAILGMLLHRERKFWRRRLIALDHPRLWAREVEDVAAFVNVSRLPIDLASIRRWIKNSPSLRDKPEEMIQVVLKLLRECYPYRLHGIGWLQPDLLREHFVEVSLKRLPELRKWLASI